MPQVMHATHLCNLVSNLGSWREDSPSHVILCPSSHATVADRRQRADRRASTWPCASRTLAPRSLITGDSATAQGRLGTKDDAGNFLAVMREASAEINKLAREGNG
jgi:hypothetical protein